MNTMRMLTLTLLFLLLCLNMTAGAEPQTKEAEQKTLSAKRNEEKQESKLSERADAKDNNGFVRTEFKITGTDCPICLNRIRDKISSLRGVQKAIIWTWSPHFGLVEFDSKLIDWQTIENSVADEHIGFADLTRGPATR